jgi:tetratricopeptide (TPR) repeat protein
MDTGWSLPEAGGEVDTRDHELGLLLFEAEEALARGSAEKAVVLASRAVKDRPDSLTARALHERARRELLRGRRRERLEARVREAEGLLAGGDAAGAERIVTSALKLIPSHPLALALFARLKERRQQAPTAEAWAEQELERLTRGRARRSLEAAQAEMAAGRERAAMMAVRRGLRQAPDDPELLALLREVEKSMERSKAGHHAVQAQVRAGLELLGHGHMDESLKVLRAVLRADPDNVRAQVAIQQVRKTWLRRQAVAAAAPPVDTGPPPPVTPAPAPPAVVRAPAPPVMPPKAPSPQAVAGPSASWQDVAAVAQGARPPSPRPRAAPASIAPARPAAARSASAGSLRAGVPRVVLIAGGAVVVIAVVAVVLRAARRPDAPAGAAAGAAVPAPTARPPQTQPPAPTIPAPGPLDAVDPGLRGAVEGALASYARALETADAGLLAQARPDLGAEERARLTAAFTGAINAATDLRVLDVEMRGELAIVSVLRTDVIVGGRGGPRDPVEETLRFARRRGEWVLIR